MNNDITNTLQLEIQTAISENSLRKFKNDVSKISQYISNDARYIIVNIFIQLGQPDLFEKGEHKTLKYKNKNECTLYIQPKIKNYITFKTKESAERYKQEELYENDLYLFLEIEDGKIII